MLKLAYEIGARLAVQKTAASTRDIGDVATPVASLVLPFPAAPVVSAVTAPSGHRISAGLGTAGGQLLGAVGGAAGGGLAGGAAGAGIGALIQYLRNKDVLEGATVGAGIGGMVGGVGGGLAGNTYGAHRGRQWGME